MSCQHGNWPPCEYCDEIETNLAELQREVEGLRAERDRLQLEIDNRWALGVHTCHENCQRQSCVQFRRAERLAEAGRRVTAAFRAHGETTPFTRGAERTRHECEAAMLALDAALEQENDDA